MVYKLKHYIHNKIRESFIIFENASEIPKYFLEYIKKLGFKQTYSDYRYVLYACEKVKIYIFNSQELKETKSITGITVSYKNIDVNSEESPTEKTITEKVKDKKEDSEKKDFVEEYKKVITKKTVNKEEHSTHYTKHPTGLECYEIAQHFNFNIGNVIKYLWRLGLKKSKSLDPKEKKIQDINKAIVYLTYERERIKKYE